VMLSHSSPVHLRWTQREWVSATGRAIGTSCVEWPFFLQPSTAETGVEAELQLDDVVEDFRFVEARVVGRLRTGWKGEERRRREARR
jgi:hypothetical protein